MVDRPKPVVSLDGIAHALSLVINILSEELHSTSTQKDALSCIVELIDITSVFCHRSKLTDMNKAFLIPQL